ncbi:hypothetical protein FI667_g3786, partial [Globisporangium splendens]
MSATHQYECDISLAFPEAVDAEYALETLQVDAELQPDKITRTLSVEGVNLIAYVPAAAAICLHSDGEDDAAARERRAAAALRAREHARPCANMRLCRPCWWRFFMERAIAAIAEQKKRKTHGAAASLLLDEGGTTGDGSAMRGVTVASDSAAGGANVMVVEEPNGSQSKAEEPLLTLTDHKRIANLQLVLDAIANATDRAGSYQLEHDQDDPSRNLIVTLTSAFLTQVMSNCSTSKENWCVWNIEARKYLTLLYWMATHTRDYASSLQSANSAVGSRSVVVETLLAWLMLPSDKNKQLVAALVLFELVQLHRQHLQLIGKERTAYTSFAGDTTPSCIQQLIQLVQQGSVAATVSTLQRYHSHSSQKVLLVSALEQLKSYIDVYRVLVLSNDEERAIDALEMLCWHWNATGMLLCTRSDAMLRTHKVKPIEAIKHTLEQQRPRGSTNKTQRLVVENTELLAAQLRRLCVLMSLTTGPAEFLQAVLVDVEAKGNFLLYLLRGLETCIRRKDHLPLASLVVKLLKALLLDEAEHDDKKKLHLVDSEEDHRALLSWLLRYYKRAVDHNTPTTRDPVMCLVKDFIVEYAILNIGCCVFELRAHVGSSDKSTVMVALSLMPAISDRLKAVSPNQVEMKTVWRRELSPAILDLLAVDDAFIRQQAFLCVPLLDLGYFTRAFTNFEAVGEYASSIGLALLFASAEGEALEEITSAFIDASRFDRTGSGLGGQDDAATVTSPRDLTQNQQSLPSDTMSNAAQAFQESVLSLSSKGWIKHVTSTSKRIQIMHVVLRKMFGSPRDPFLLRFLRELVAAGWIDNDTFQSIVSILTQHMESQIRLTENLLEDQSAGAAAAVEALLFARLAPVLVLRVLPRSCFVEQFDGKLHCEVEDLQHVQEIVQDSRGTASRNPGYDLFHLLVLQVLDPLEFKEVKMLAVEILAKFAPARVAPFVFSQLLAFLREEAPLISATTFTESLYEPALKGMEIPGFCGITAAKLMMYYLNRVINEDLEVYADPNLVPVVVSIILQILSIPCVGETTGAERSLLADLQMGCMDCIALLTLRNMAKTAQTKQGKRGSSLMDLLLDWITFNDLTSDASSGAGSSDELVRAVHMRALLLVSSSFEGRQSSLPPQVRICCCNIMLRFEL